MHQVLEVVTQYCENYGDSQNISYKFKGGNVYHFYGFRKEQDGFVLANAYINGEGTLNNSNGYQGAVDVIRSIKLIEVEDINALTEEEKDQLETIGEVYDPVLRIDLSGEYEG